MEARPGTHAHGTQHIFQKSMLHQSGTENSSEQFQILKCSGVPAGQQFPKASSPSHRSLNSEEESVVIRLAIQNVEWLPRTRMGMGTGKPQSTGMLVH